jgi:hypothetical protein
MGSVKIKVLEFKLSEWDLSFNGSLVGFEMNLAHGSRT